MPMEGDFYFSNVVAPYVPQVRVGGGPEAQYQNVMPEYRAAVTPHAYMQNGVTADSGAPNMQALLNTYAQNVQGNNEFWKQVPESERWKYEYTNPDGTKGWRVGAPGLNLVENAWLLPLIATGAGLAATGGMGGLFGSAAAPSPFSLAGGTGTLGGASAASTANAMATGGAGLTAGAGSLAPSLGAGSIAGGAAAGGAALGGMTGGLTGGSGLASAANGIGSLLGGAKNVLPALGAIAGGVMGSEGATNTQSASRVPWEAAQPWIKENMAASQALQKRYQEQPISQEQKAAFQQRANDAAAFRNTQRSLLEQMSNRRGFDRANPRAQPARMNFTRGLFGG